MAEQVLCALLVEDGARVDTRRNLEGNAARDIGLDETRDDIDRGALGSEQQVDTRGTRLLREAGDELLNLLADDNHHVCELVEHHKDR